MNEQVRPRGFATAKEAAVFLGISKSMVHKLILAEAIPATKWGSRCIRISWEWLYAQSGKHLYRR